MYHANAVLSLIKQATGFQEPNTIKMLQHSMAMYLYDSYARHG